jgi:hypothetical protein
MPQSGTSRPRHSGFGAGIRILPPPRIVCRAAYRRLVNEAGVAEYRPQPTPALAAVAVLASAPYHTGNPGIERTLTVTVERPMSWRDGQDLWIGRVGRRYRLISRSAGKVWLCQIRREGSSG